MAKQTDPKAAPPQGHSPPTDEQVKELVLILDKEKALLTALAGVDAEGKLKTVPPDDKHYTHYTSPYYIFSLVKHVQAIISHIIKITFSHS